MTIHKLITAIIALTVFFCFAEVHAATSLGVRIPTAYIVTTGVGQSDEGLPPDPYETFSYDLALQQAGIENFNVIYYTSVLPPESYEISLAEARKYFHHGAVLESIMAKAGGVKDDTIAAGVGRIWAIDPVSKQKIGGFAAEYEFIYKGEKVSPAKAEQDAKAQLTKSLMHELTIRNLEQTGDIEFNITSAHIEKNYGIALAQLGFVSFIYLDPIPIQ